MDADFGLLVDFLRGELDPGEAARVRVRLEQEDTLFVMFERLRRTYAVLHSMPRIGNGESVFGNRESDPDRFPEQLRHEFQTRGLSALIPYISATPQYLAALRVEFSVRAVCACLPQLVVGESWLAALHAEFGSRALVDSLPFINARPSWIRALRGEFSVRAVVAGIPQITARPEFVAALRAEFRQRALVASIPEMDVRAGFERRLKVALVEAQRDTATMPAALPAALPVVEASDPFRRRLFKKILVNSRRRVREVPLRVDPDEYQWGREMRQDFRQSRRSLAFTFVLHAVAIGVLLFVFVKQDSAGAAPYIAYGESEYSVVPALPEPRGDVGMRSNPERVAVPSARHEDWSSSKEDPAVGLAGDEFPDRERRVDEQPPEQREFGREEVLGRIEHDTVASFFRLRGLTKQQKIDYLGNADLYDALDRSLNWLASAQQMNPDADGSWGFINVEYITKDPDLKDVQKLEMTCAAVLAFLGDGHSSEQSPVDKYRFAVKRGIEWILKQQKADGQIGPASKGNVLVHAMGTLVLAEEFGLTRRHDLRDPLRKACRWLCEVRAKDSAGFPFQLNQDASMSTSVWAYMALATARNVKVPPIDLPQQRIDDFLGWYKDQAQSEFALSDTGPVLGSELLADSAAAAMAQFSVLETESLDAQALTGLAGRYTEKISLKAPNLAPPAKKDEYRDNGDVRYLFFGSIAQAINVQRGGVRSKDWNEAFKKTLLQNQSNGAWPTTGAYHSLYGDVFGVAMASLSIENAYRVSIIK